MSADGSSFATPRSERALERIVAASVRRFAGAPPAEVSLSDIAAEAGVSKALIIYHFGDRESLVAAVVDRVADDVVARERAALHNDGTALAVDVLWRWLEDELLRGDIRILLSLGDLRSTTVREATARAAARRRATAAETVTRLFAALGVRPRVPAPLIGDAAVAFTDGLALDASRPPAAQRVAFDVFWLAMLDLTE